MCRSKVRVLYISYTGMLEPLGQSQVLSYLERLVDTHRVALISFEKSTDWNDTALRRGLQRRLAAAGIDWHPLRYHKRLSVGSTAYDVFRGLVVARRIARQRRIQIVHARSYVAALIALPIQREYGSRFVFDMRGFWADEKAEAGSWSRISLVYRLAKQFERLFLRRADVVISLTRAGVEAMQGSEFPGMTAKVFAVIPTCADLQRFRPTKRELDRPFTFGYVGNAGGWYRFGPVVEAFKAIREKRPDARFVIVNRGQHETIRAHLAAHGVREESVELRALDFSDVPEAIAGMDATAFFSEPTFAEKGRAPTKLAEFLGCGVPCLVNDGVGDVAQIVREDQVGVVVDELTTTAVREGVQRLMDLVGDRGTEDRCVESARRRYSLDSGVAAYDKIYRSLARPGDRAPRELTG